MPPGFDSKYKMKQELGAGAYGTVYQCTCLATREERAVKVIDKTKAGPKDINDLQHEVTLMKTIGMHPHVVQLHESFDTPNQMFLVLDLLEGGMLFDRIVQCKHYSEKHAAILIKNFLNALQHIHSKGIMHRDLKPENLLLRHESSTTDSHLTDVALADFGLSGRIPGQTCCGSPSYIAPEVINVGYLRTQKEPYDSKCDIWSLGTIAYILISGKMPFHGNNFKEIFAKIVKNQWSFVGDVWNSVSEDAKDFVKLMLTPDPKKRPTATEALKHAWLSKTAPDVHLPAAIDELKRFNAQQKLRGAMLVFRATSSFLGNLDQTPPFMKYLRHKNLLSTVIESQSQSDSKTVHLVDYSRSLLKALPGWKLQDCCTCGSKPVCRHIQNVHEYLFVGKRDMDVHPFVHQLHLQKQELEIDILEDPGNRRIRLKLEEIENCLNAARIFSMELRKVPQEEFKPNFMLHHSLGAGPSVKKMFASKEKK